MKIVDANIILYAYDASSPFHDRARKWFESCFTHAEPIGFTVATIVAFVRLITDARVFAKPLGIETACTHVDEWLSQASAVLLLPTGRHWEILRALLVETRAKGPLIPDAHLAASAIEHGATLYTNDRDFLRFRGVRVEYPLA